jgi:type IV pilus assembly protein PilN
MRISLNLASRPYTDQGPAIRQLRIAMAVLLLLIGVLAWGLETFHQAALKMAADQDQLQQSIARIRAEQQGYQIQMQQPKNARVLTQATFLNQLFEEKSFSWTATMEDLEPVLPAGVQVTAIEPIRAKDGTLTLHLRVNGIRERAVEMIRNMEHSRRFVSPRITGENAENSSGPGEQQVANGPTRVTFDILAEYNPATLAERKAAGKRDAATEFAADSSPAQSPARAAAQNPAPVQRQAYTPAPPNPGQPPPQGTIRPFPPTTIHPRNGGNQ